MARKPMLLAQGYQDILKPPLEWPLPSAANAGLVWDRFLTIWQGDNANPERSELFGPLAEFVQAFNRRGEGPRNPARDLLRFQNERLERTAQAWSRADKARTMPSLHYRVTWRLAVGLGTDHPTENGFSFDPLIGVPYLPGSSVKGLCRRAAVLEELAETRIERLLGPEQAALAGYAFQDRLVFLDAYPRRWPKLAVDIVNCHHPKYYQGNGLFPRFAQETENPVPVFFVTVDRDSEFTFRIGCRESDLDQTKALLARGLEWLGIGAKTAVGYGVMEPSSETR